MATLEKRAKGNEERIKTFLDYSPETGLFIWKEKPHKNNHMNVGDIAGTLRPVGYIVIGLDKKYHFAQRLAWFMYYGEWPSVDIDHINGIKSDNRLCNLRLATRQENTQNEHKARSNNKSGLLGVHYIDGRYRARLSINGKSTFLGRFKTAEEAHDCYVKAKRKHHPFFML